MDHFLGIVKYFGRLIPRLSDKEKCFNNFRSGEFRWTDIHTQSFNNLKNELSTYPVVQPYSLEKEVTVTTDASKHAVSASLMQEEKPVIYILRTLSQSKRNQSNAVFHLTIIAWKTTK